MMRYGKINTENIVENTIVCDDFTISSMPGEYVKITESTGNASIGDIYLPESSKFVRPQPYESWSLDENFEWISPLGDNPNPALNTWDEESQEWVSRS